MSKNTVLRNTRRNGKPRITLNTLYDLIMGVSNKVDVLTTRVDVLTTRVDDIAADIKIMKDDIKKLQQYNKTQSNIQELSHRHFIITLYSRNSPNSRVIPIDIKEFYSADSKNPITEFDGFIMLEHRMNKVPKCSNELLDRIKQHPQLSQTDMYTTTLRHNAEDCVKVNDVRYILIESKHSLTKQKIDKKLRQVSKIRDVFLDISKMETATYDKTPYMTMVQQLQEETGLQLSQIIHPIYVIFASDDISSVLAQYIRAIYNGIATEAEYNTLTSEMFYDDVIVKEYIKTIKENDLTNWLSKALKEKAPLSEEIKGAMMNRPDYSSYKDYLSTYFESFSTIQQLLDTSKGLVGLLQFNNVYLPELFHITNLNSMSA